MDPSLMKVEVASMADVDAAFHKYDRKSVQLHVLESTALLDAVDMNARVVAGIRSDDAFQLFNPEMLARKVEAEAALRTAIDRIDLDIMEANEGIAATQEELVAVQRALAPGPDAIRVGPSINRRGVDRDRVIFPSHSPMPEEGIAPKRRMSMTSKLRSRGLDADSQTDFLELNLMALQQKEALQAAYRDGLIQLREDFSQRALMQPTSIGCGYSNFNFRF